VKSIKNVVFYGKELTAALTASYSEHILHHGIRQLTKFCTKVRILNSLIMQLSEWTRITDT